MERRRVDDSPAYLADATRIETLPYLTYQSGQLPATIEAKLVGGAQMLRPKSPQTARLTLSKDSFYGSYLYDTLISQEPPAARKPLPGTWSIG